MATVGVPPLCAISGWHRNIAIEFIADTLAAVTTRIYTAEQQRMHMLHTLDGELYRRQLRPAKHQ